MIVIIKKKFIVWLSNKVNGYNLTKCMLLSNQKCMIQPTLINLYCNKYSQESHYYLHAIKLDRCVGSFNTLNDLSNKVYVPIKQKNYV